MYPDIRYRTQSGAGLPIALFVITVLALIVVSIAELQQSTGESISLQIQSQRAFYAAESGAQVALRDALESASCAAVQSPLSFSAAGLRGCQAMVQCQTLQADVLGNGVDDTIYVLVSEGMCGSGLDQARRVIEVRAR